MDDLKNRIIEISKKLKLSHIGSNLSCLPVLEEIYAKKKPGDIVILCNAHAHLAHLVVKQSKGEIAIPTYQNTIPSEEYIKADIARSVEEIINQYGIHCDRQAGCDASGGSLGHGLGIAIGYALADSKRDVYVIVSEGSMMEGSSWEALATIERLGGVPNLHIYTNFNGYSAVGKVDREKLSNRMNSFNTEINFRYTENGEGFEGLAGHYKVLTD